MNKNLKFGFLVTTLSLLAALAVAPAGAAAPLDVHIEVIATIDPDADPFVASGPAVDEGALCSNGDSVDTSVIVTSPPGGTIRILRVEKTFTCEDGSGTFYVSMVVQLDTTTHYTTAQWRITGGTGNYTGLHGNGSLNGTPIVPGESILDVYDGTIH